MSAKKFCVLGQGISYSLSPLLHSAIFEFFGEDCEYGVADVPPEKLYETVKKLLGEYDGFNVTKPYKESVARILGASGPINTVRCADCAATSTDAEGFLCDYIEAFGEPKGDILLLGAGGAAKSVAEALSNSRGVLNVYVFNRTYENAQKLEGGKVKAVRDLPNKFHSVINCTSAGLNGEQSAPAELDFGKAQYAYDLIYSPPETPFLAKTSAAGLKTRNGMGMLIWQAIAAHEFWRKRKFDLQAKRELAEYVKKKLAEGK